MSRCTTLAATSGKRTAHEWMACRGAFMLVKGIAYVAVHALCICLRRFTLAALPGSCNTWRWIACLPWRTQHTRQGRPGHVKQSRSSTWMGFNITTLGKPHDGDAQMFHAGGLRTWGPVTGLAMGSGTYKRQPGVDLIQELPGADINYALGSQ